MPNEIDYLNPSVSDVIAYFNEGGVMVALGSSFRFLDVEEFDAVMWNMNRPIL